VAGQPERVQDASMTFAIRFTEEEPSDPPVAHGEIVLNDCIEHFTACLGRWQVRDYEQQWMGALERIVSGADKSCLVVSLSEPGYNDFVICWPMHRIDNHVVFQETLVPPQDFYPADPHGHVPEHAAINDDGTRISAWAVRLTDVAAFLREM
jgi:hypothetical protein